MTQYVIVGDGVAGHTAAETIREHDEDATIHVFTMEDTPFYDRIGLRAYVRSGRSEDDLVLNDADWYADHDIDLHLNTKVTTIDRDAQEVVTDDGTYKYDKLLLAVGGTPRTLPMEDGVDNVHHLWTLADHGRPLRADLEDAENAVVIGGGLLGFDLVGSFSQTDTDTTYLIREEHWLSRALDPAGAQLIHDAMEDHGVDVHTEEVARTMEQEDGQVYIETDCDAYTVDVVGVAVGHVRHLGLADDAELDTHHGIICNAYLQTVDPDIFVAGDVAEYADVVLERRNMGGSWVIAQEQGEHAGENMVRAAHGGTMEPFESVDTYTVMHFGLNVATLGDPIAGEDQAVITALDEDGQQYRRLVLENHDDGQRIVGAAIIGAMQWMHPLKQLIRNKANVSDRIAELEDPECNPKKLV